MSYLAIVALRGFLVLIFFLALLGQAVVIPAIAAETAQTFPEFAFLAPPYTIVIVAGIACVQFALIAVWALLSMVQSGAIFTEHAFRWVNAIIGAAIVATVLVIALGAHVLFVVQNGGPVVVLALGAATIGGLAFVLFMIVMRGLLQSAMRLENELAEVV